MGLKRDVIIKIYYMSNGLTFEILNIILRNSRDIWILLKNDFTKFHENRLIIDGEINEKHALLVSCGLRYNRPIVALSGLRAQRVRCGRAVVKGSPFTMA